MAKAIRTREGGRIQAEGRLRRGANYLRSARRDLDERNFDSAIVMAIQAAIAANDAACIALGRRRAANEDHHRAIELLRQLGGSSGEVNSKAGQLEWLLDRKNRSEYGDAPTQEAEARNAYERAQRFTDWTQEQVTNAFPQ